MAEEASRKNPMLSIIMPIYNVEIYVEQCLQSILTQSFKDFELIIIDDGSIDNSRSICNKYAAIDSRIVIYTQNNEGLSSARNYGLSKAKGSYIGFVDSDDYLDLTMYEKMISSALNNSADIVICGRVIDRNGNLQRINYNERILNGIEATKEILMDSNIKSYAWDKIYKKSLWKDITFPIGRYFEDTSTIYKVFERSSKVVQISDCLYYYRFNENSICNHPDINKRLKRVYDNFEAFHERYLYICLNNIYTDIRSNCVLQAFIYGTDALIFDMFLNKSTYQKYIRSMINQLHSQDFPIRNRISYYFVRYFFSIYKLRIWFKWKKNIKSTLNL